MGFLHNVGARASVMFFLKTFIFLLFKVTKSHQKAMSKVRTIVCCRKRKSNSIEFDQTQSVD